MNLFPNICIDNFLENPYKFIEISKNLKYTEDHYGYGLRSQPLDQVNKDLYRYINLKIINAIYPNAGPLEFVADTTFQKCHANIGDGWVHKDEGYLTAIIYLNPEGTFGTSIYKKINEYEWYNQDEKRKYFRNTKEYSEEEVKKVEEAKIKNNKKFIKTIDYSGNFNRLICFSAGTFHAAQPNEFYLNKERLIIISFIKFIKVNIFPIAGFSNLEF